MNNQMMIKPSPRELDAGKENKSCQTYFSTQTMSEVLGEQQQQQQQEDEPSIRARLFIRFFLEYLSQTTTINNNKNNGEIQTYKSKMAA